MHWAIVSRRMLCVRAGIAVAFLAVSGGAFGASREITVDHGAQHPGVSPDGSQIAASILGKLWLIPARGGDARQLTWGTGWDTHPAWSLDGQFLAYSHFVQGESDLTVLNLTTGTESVVTHLIGQVGQIQYAPDGSHIFFILRRKDSGHIERIGLAGGKADRVTESDGWHEWSFTVSPDGTELLTDSGRHGGSNLYRIDLKDRNATRLTRTVASQGHVAWARDGNKYFYLETLNGVETLFAQPAAGGERRAVHESPYRDTDLALAPDGTTAVLCAGRQLFRVDLSNGRLTPIPFRARFELPARSPGDLLVTHARVVNGAFAPVVDDATIEIRNGRFRAIHSGDEFVAPPGVSTIDAGGRTVLPGLMDNHFHFLEPFMGAALLSRGVTSIRDTGGHLSESIGYKEAINLGLLEGPDIYAAGPLIDGPGSYHPWAAVELDDPANAASLVASLKDQGVDLLKVYFLLRADVLCAVIRAAHAQGLSVTGHLGVRTSWTRAMACHIDGLNHVRVWADVLPAVEQPQGENDSLDADVHFVARMQADWRKIDPQGPAAGALIADLATGGIGFDPTLSVQFLEDRERNTLSLEDFTLARNAYVRMGSFVARAERAGVLLLAGTDNGSLWDEMEAYENAGVPRAAIIRAATSNGARWLGKQADFGSIEPGRRADLIIVDGDPMTQIKDVRNIRTVIKDGRVVFEITPGIQAQAPRGDQSR